MLISNTLTKRIMESMKAHDTVRTETLRSIKAAFTNWQTNGQHVNKQLTENDEIRIIQKLVKQRQESIEQFKEACRHELAEHEQQQLEVLKEFLPAEVTEAEIVKEFDTLTASIEPVKKNMGLFIKAIKEKYPAADGKLVSQVVSSHLA